MVISVIVPAYNHARYLRQRLDSLLYQTYKDFELIILDDASTDNSREIILEYAKSNPEIITCFNDKNSGSPFKQWNKGVSLAKGQYIWIAESDDFADPDFLTKTVIEITKSENTGLVYCDTWILDEQRRIKYLYSDKNRNTENTLKSFVSNPIPNVSSVLFSKDAFLEAGGADTSMKFCGDWFLYLKIRKNCKIIYVANPLSTFRLHEHSRYHQHYSTNEFLKEKLTIYKYLIKESRFSPFRLIMVLKSIIISFGLRIGHIINLPASLVPARPRTPQKIEYI